MDELNCADFPGETFRETIGLKKYQAFRSQFLPDRTYFIVD
jgi:hypothetical protein